jgi:hypothetical protein
MYADYQELAAAFARQCRERRNAEDEAQREVDELTKPATVPSAADVRKTGAGAGLVFKTRNDARVADDDDSGASVERTLPTRRASAKSGSEMPWWKWVDQRIDYRLEAFARTTETAVGQVVGEIRAQMREHCAGEIGVVKREVEQQNREFAVRLHEQMLECGRDLREEARAAREQQERRDAVTLYEIGVARRELALLREAGAEALGFIKRELEQQRAAFNAQTELQREREQLRAEVAKDDRLRMQSESHLLRRELTTLREEVAIERGLQALKAEIAAAKAEVPKVPAIEARINAKQSALAAEQARLDRELAKTKDRLGKLRVDQSVTDHGLKELQRAQKPVVELRFESVDGQFTMRDMHPDAAAAWRRFVREMVEGNDGTMFPNDPTGRVVALPSGGAA